MTTHFYSRFSPRPDEDTSDSCRNQLAEMTAKHGLAQHYADEALSGADHDRPELLRLLAAIKRGDTVYVRDFSRLSRDTHHLLGLAMEITGRGARLISLKEGEYKPKDKVAKFTFRILAAVAELQRDSIKEATSARMLAHQASGRRMSARPPYGMRVDPADPARMIPHEGEQQAIERARELRGQGLSPRKVAAQLEAEGYPRRGKVWQQTTVIKMLKRKA